MRLNVSRLLRIGLLAGLIPASIHGQDRAALLAARRIQDPAARVTALLGLAQQHPGTDLAQQASMLALEADLAHFSDRTAEIHTLASADVAGTAAGFERWSEESRIADLLASAGASGADLADAQIWARNAVDALTEQSYRRQMTVMRARYKLDAQTAKQARHDFAQYRASFLAALANVDLREKDLPGAERALAEAARLSPLSSEVSSLQGQLALARRQDREALADFERAEAEGDLKEPWRAEMVRLYRQLDGGGAAATDSSAESKLNAQIDVVYRGLFPPLFTLRPRRLPAGGHTVLLELFTGSGCQPCAAPDLAVESLLTTYTRQDLVVLEYDEHIPLPDPLANPDSVARAASYGVETTPQAFLDGEELPVVGASRADVEDVVVGFAEQIEDHAADPSGIRLRVVATRDAKGEITAQATVSAAPLPVAGEVVPPLPAHPVVRFALVQDGIRYSGENGIRFHRMVVRAMAKAAGPDLSAAAAPAEISASFDTAEIARDQMLYLNAYAKGNERFGPVRFLATDLPMTPDQLAVVAWIEDPATHAVLQTAYTAVSAR